MKNNSELRICPRFTHQSFLSWLKKRTAELSDDLTLFSVKGQDFRWRVARLCCRKHSNGSIQHILNGKDTPCFFVPFVFRKFGGLGW